MLWLFFGFYCVRSSTYRNVCVFALNLRIVKTKNCDILNIILKKRSIGLDVISCVQAED